MRTVQAPSDPLHNNSFSEIFSHADTNAKHYTDIRHYLYFPTNLAIVTTTAGMSFFIDERVMLYLLFGKHLGGLSGLEFELDDKVTLTTDTDLHSIDV